MHALLLTIGQQRDKMQQGKYVFLSCATSKWGRFHVSTSINITAGTLYSFNHSHTRQLCKELTCTSGWDLCQGQPAAPPKLLLFPTSKKCDKILARTEFLPHFFFLCLVIMINFPPRLPSKNIKQVLTWKLWSFAGALQKDWHNCFKKALLEY